MAFQIRVEPEMLRQAAGDIEQIISENDDIINRTKLLASKLDESWDGTASSSMVDKLQELSECTNVAKEELGNSVLRLQSVAQAFENIDDGENSGLSGAFISGHIPIDINRVIGKKLELFSPESISLFSASIRVVPDGLKEVVNESKTVIEMSNGLSDRILEIKNKLQNSWEGRAYNKFSENFIQIREAYINFSEALEEISQKILSAANRYEEIDNMFN